MRAWLMRVIHWLFGGRRGPYDPALGVRHPIARRPGGRHGAIALEEPDEHPSLTLVGKAK